MLKVITDLSLSITRLKIVLSKELKNGMTRAKISMPKSQPENSLIAN